MLWHGTAKNVPPNQPVPGDRPSLVEAIVPTVNGTHPKKWALLGCTAQVWVLSGISSPKSDPFTTSMPLTLPALGPSSGSVRRACECSWAARRRRRGRPAAAAVRPSRLDLRFPRRRFQGAGSREKAKCPDPSPDPPWQGVEPCITKGTRGPEPNPCFVSGADP